jgi:hypothetical protein
VWEHTNIPEIVTELIQSYDSVTSNPPITPTAPLTWNPYDYDSIWTVTIDANGSLKVDNSLCEGIDSNNLPNTAPQF